MTVKREAPKYSRKERKYLRRPNVFARVDDHPVMARDSLKGLIEEMHRMERHGERIARNIQRAAKAGDYQKAQRLASLLADHRGRLGNVVQSILEIERKAKAKATPSNDRYRRLTKAERNRLLIRG